MDTLLVSLKRDFPALNFEKGQKFTWSPKTASIIYNPDTSKEDIVATWSLLHEAGHALLAHKTYTSDFELLKMEVEAWSKAKELAAAYNITIDTDHIEDCLDTYRDWLYARSTCPTCTVSSIQIENRLYKCFNCGTKWRVSQSRHCRPYRLKQKETLDTESL